MDDREELRRLIDVIEKGSGTTSLEQAVDDLKTFANTASFLANNLDARLHKNDIASKGRAKNPKAKIPKPIRPPAPSPAKASKPIETPPKAAAAGISKGISQADYDRLKPQRPQRPLGPM
jgi:hypothetical protein